VTARGIPEVTGFGRGRELWISKVA